MFAKSLCLAIVLAACGSNGRQIVDPAPIVGERSVTIAAGKLVELNLDVPVSTLVAAVPIDPIEVAFEASDVLAWNIHVHPESGAPEVVQEGMHAVGVILHTPGRPGPISLLWENRGAAPITVTLRVMSLPAGTTGEWYPAP